MKKTDLLVLVIGIAIGSVTTYVFMYGLDFHFQPFDKHPIGYTENEDEVHVHSDFVVHLDGKTIDLTQDKYQSKAGHVLHADIHLHDNNDDVVHRHDHGVTLGEFFASLGFELTNECVTTDDKVSFCNNDNKKLMVFVNDKHLEDPVNYVNQEEDRILFYYGESSDSETIKNLLLSVTDQACIYSGTCPERGTAPPESCGLTCDL